MRSPDREPRPILAAALTLLMSLFPFAATGAESDALEELEMPSKWLPTIEARLWTGYKDNVLLANRNTISSPFVAGGLDLALFRLPVNGWEWFFLSSSDYTRYLNAPEVDQEAVALVQAKGQKTFGSGWQAGLATEYMYFNQVFDASVLEDEFLPLQVEGHGVTLRPSVIKDLTGSYRLELELPGSRQWFGDVIDDYWEFGPKLTLAREFGREAEIAASYQFDERLHDTREARDAFGEPISGRILHFHQHEAALAWRQFWDAQRRWRTVTKLSVQRNDDNGGGYYDYYRPQFSEQVRFQAKRWEASVEARVSHYLYDRQRIAGAASPIRERTYFRVNARGEKTISKAFKLFAEVEHERAVSNLDFDTYTVTSVSGGVTWEY